MASAQRYVSSELTHFVGRKENGEDAQYNLLLKILKTGRLTSVPMSTGDSWGFGTNYQSKMSDNRMYGANVVCFCDIPVDDLGLHIRKYSRFGLAFLKAFLVRHGASPVFYLAKNSTAPIWFKIMEPGRSAPPADRTRAEIFDNMTSEYTRLFQEVSALFASKENPTVVVPESYQRAHDVRKFIDALILCFVKFFDDSKAEEDPDNYYMEREWRLLSHLRFDLPDVRRIILPSSYAKQFRRDLPDYVGQITFAD